MWFKFLFRVCSPALFMLLIVSQPTVAGTMTENSFTKQVSIRVAGPDRLIKYAVDLVGRVSKAVLNKIPETHPKRFTWWRRLRDYKEEIKAAKNNQMIFTAMEKCHNYVENKIIPEAPELQGLLDVVKRGVKVLRLIEKAK